MHVYITNKATSARRRHMHLVPMQAAGMKTGGIHGDIDQYSRMEALKKFKAGTTHVLVATDVAARGLDVRSVKAVVNYDVAASVDTHVHRIGRTGRAGDRDGTAYTLLMPHESRMAAAIASGLGLAGQEVSKCDSVSLAPASPLHHMSSGCHLVKSYERLIAGNRADFVSDKNESKNLRSKKNSVASA